YGMNNWIYIGTSPAYYNIKTANSEATIPVFVDSAWHDIRPEETDPPAVSLANQEGRPADQSLSDVIMNRHIKAVNVAFWDAHVENVPNQNLGLIKWSKDWTRTSVFDNRLLEISYKNLQ